MTANMAARHEANSRVARSWALAIAGVRSWHRCSRIKAIRVTDSLVVTPVNDDQVTHYDPAPFSAAMAARIASTNEVV